jgi:hypothetical protein
MSANDLIAGPTALALAIAAQSQIDAHDGDLSAQGFLYAAGVNIEGFPVRPTYRKPTRPAWPRTQAAAMQQQQAA